MQPQGITAGDTDSLNLPLSTWILLAPPGKHSQQRVKSKDNNIQTMLQSLQNVFTNMALLEIRNNFVCTYS